MNFVVCRLFEVVPDLSSSTPPLALNFRARYRLTFGEVRLT